MKTIVLGAGIAGLTASYQLKKAGKPFLLLEKSSRWGGRIQSLRHHGFLLEMGPNSFLENQETLADHIRELDIQKQKTPSKPAAKNRYILHKRKLRRVPKSGFDFFKTSLLSPMGKMRLLMEPLIPANSSEEESVAQFVTRRLGKEALHLVGPMIHGIYAGNAANLSMPAIAPNIAKWEQEYGSLFKALSKARLFSKGQTLSSFHDGLQTLVNGLYEEVREQCLLDCQDIRLIKEKSTWRVKWKQADKTHEEEASSILLALPAYAAASLLETVDPNLSIVLKSIPYVSVSVVHLVVDRSTLKRPLNGFGFLTGTKESNLLLGCLWSSTIFDSRCPDDQSVLLTCFVGGAKNPSAMMLSEEAILQKVVEELHPLLGRALKVTDSVVTKISNAIPQYTLGHKNKLRGIQEQLQLSKGLYLTGNYFSGISINDTMRNAVQEVQNIYDAN
ncbi:MAG: protoporphyrinogen oxidase [Deltaproteobacteria bacterium]|nr:protoporphyrinogen oxidase [Deltaproteobacteria bacterium]